MTGICKPQARVVPVALPQCTLVRLAGLVDRSDRSILIFRPKQEPVMYRGDHCLPVFEGLEFALTAAHVFE